MTTSRKVAANTGVLFTTRILYSLVSLVVAAFLARYLGSTGYGTYSLVFAYLYFFQILTGQGIDTIVIREISKDRSREPSLIGNAILFKLLLSLLAIAASVLVAQFMGYPGETKNLIYIASLGLVFSFSPIYTALFQARLEVKYYAVPELAINFLFAGLTFVCIAFQAPIWAFVLLQTIVVIPVTLIYMVLSKRVLQLKVDFRQDPGIFKYFISETWPIFISSIFIAINTRIDQLMLFKLVDAKSLGLYSASVRLTESLHIIPLVFMTSVYPLLCECFSRSEKTFEKLYDRSFKYMSIIIVPIAVGTTLLSEQIISFFYGPDFLEASGALSILIWSEIFVFLGVVFSNVLLASGKQRFLFGFTFVGAATNVLLNIFLIPRYGIIGASIATLAAYTGPGVILQYGVKETRKMFSSYIASILMPVICSIPIVLFILSFKNIPVYFTVLISALIYSIMIAVTKTLNREDIEYFKSIFAHTQQNTKNVQ